MKKKLDLDDIDHIQQHPLEAARNIQELRTDVMQMLSSVEDANTATDPAVKSSRLSTLIYNMRQKYPKEAK